MASQMVYVLSLDKVIELKEDMSFPDDIVIFESNMANNINVTGFYDMSMEIFLWWFLVWA